MEYGHITGLLVPMYTKAGFLSMFFLSFRLMGLILRKYLSLSILYLKVPANDWQGYIYFRGGSSFIKEVDSIYQASGYHLIFWCWESNKQYILKYVSNWVCMLPEGSTAALGIIDTSQKVSKATINHNCMLKAEYYWVKYYTWNNLNVYPYVIIQVMLSFALLEQQTT